MYSHFLWLQDSDMQRLADALRDGAYFWMDAGRSTPWIGCPPYCCFWVLFFNFGVHLRCLCQMIAQGCNPPTPATAPRQCRINTVLVPGLSVLNTPPWAAGCGVQGSGWGREHVSLSIHLISKWRWASDSKISVERQLWVGQWRHLISKELDLGTHKTFDTTGCW